MEHAPQDALEVPPGCRPGRYGQRPFDPRTRSADHRTGRPPQRGQSPLAGADRRVRSSQRLVRWRHAVVCALAQLEVRARPGRGAREGPRGQGDRVAAEDLGGDGQRALELFEGAGAHARGDARHRGRAAQRRAATAPPITSRRSCGSSVACRRSKNSRARRGSTRNGGSRISTTATARWWSSCSSRPRAARCSCRRSRPRCRKFRCRMIVKIRCTFQLKRRRPLRLVNVTTAACVAPMPSS